MTPIRRQYLRIKQRYLDSIVLFRLGDFYETFDEDARLASRELDIVLTTKSMGKDLKVPLAGIPAHSLDPYLAKLIKKGYKVAICEQLSDPCHLKRAGGAGCGPGCNPGHRRGVLTLGAGRKQLPGYRIAGR